MQITDAKYIANQLGDDCVVQATIDGKTMHVPMAADNRHYAAIVAWVDEGNTIQAADSE
tara:strand:- start:201 stop:377 length:177 start_codon:yes stop_codon:yes gene_type:complete